jgi:hypothetical protein
MREEFQFQFISTTNNLKTKTEFRPISECKVREFSQLEAQRLAESMRKKNVVARFGGANNYYLNHATELGEQTIIEVSIIATKDDVIDLGMALASIVEKLAILSTTFTIKRKSLHRKLGISSISKSEICFAFTHSFQTLRAKSNRALKIDGISVDKTFCNRFNNCGFVELLRFIQMEKELNKRVMSSINWLYESRREFKINASVVKSAIALESLLIFSESESLARTLAERTAFLLSNTIETRQKISRIILRFYEVRSGIVHGSQKKAKKLSENLIECVDRLILLIHLTIANNQHLWTNLDSLRLWYEEQRWGKPFDNVVLPFSQSYLMNALSLVEEEMTISSQ